MTTHLFLECLVFVVHKDPAQSPSRYEISLCSAPTCENGHIVGDGGQRVELLPCKYLQREGGRGEGGREGGREGGKEGGRGNKARIQLETEDRLSVKSGASHTMSATAAVYHPSIRLIGDDWYSVSLGHSHNVLQVLP